MTASMSLGRADDDCVSLRVVDWEHPGAESVIDRNWIVCEVSVLAGGFTARCRGSLWASEISHFREQLEQAYEHVRGSAEIHALEFWFDLTVACEPTGQLTVKTTVRDPMHFDRELQVELRDLDQSYLPPVIEQLRAIEAEFPAPRGS